MIAIPNQRLDFHFSWLSWINFVHHTHHWHNSVLTPRWCFNTGIQSGQLCSLHLQPLSIMMHAAPVTQISWLGSTFICPQKRPKLLSEVDQRYVGTADGQACAVRTLLSQESWAQKGIVQAYWKGGDWWKNVKSIVQNITGNSNYLIWHWIKGKEEAK